jgi:hypothetical protein
VRRRGGDSARIDTRKLAVEFQSSAAFANEKRIPHPSNPATRTPKIRNERAKEERRGGRSLLAPGRAPPSESDDFRFGAGARFSAGGPQAVKCFSHRECKPAGKLEPMRERDALHQPDEIFQTRCGLLDDSSRRRPLIRPHLPRMTLDVYRSDPGLSLSPAHW